MLFNSYSFIFIFLPSCLVLFHLALKYKKSKLALSILLLFSWGFYAYWNPIYLPLLLLSILVNYASGIYLKETKSRIFLALGVVFNLVLLGYFKYIDFGITIINQLAGLDLALTQVLLPLAISFFTFQQVAFLVDSYRNDTPPYDFISYALFVSFFPQLIAGPIVSAQQILPQLNTISTVKFSNLNENIAIGILIFLMGLFKKVVIADQLSPLVAKSFDSGILLSSFDAWTGALAYTLQIYFDFSGYSDMAIGLGYMFGIQLPINFFSPYRALSIIDFWKRWHITLSLFLRNYLYIPLGGNRSGVLYQMRNLLITMLLGGLWHGAGWTFVVWGGLHGFYLCINHLWQQNQLFIAYKSTIPYKIATWMVTMFAVIVAWVFFRSSSLEAANQMILAMFGLTEHPGIFFKLKHLVGLIALFIACYFLPNIPQVLGHGRYPGCIVQVNTTLPQPNRYFWQFKPNVYWLIAKISLAMWVILSLEQETEFLYFDF